MCLSTALVKIIIVLYPSALYIHIVTDHVNSLRLNTVLLSTHWRSCYYWPYSYQQEYRLLPNCTRKCVINYTNTPIILFTHYILTPSTYIQIRSSKWNTNDSCMKTSFFPFSLLRSLVLGSVPVPGNVVYTRGTNHCAPVRMHECSIKS